MASNHGSPGQLDVLANLDGESYQYRKCSVMFAYSALSRLRDSSGDELFW